ncbi:hypothetical protein J6590_044195 [Homalodisca vitripennis]|nr:hypothetical protein J6590_044195 [Homalodisca vitripennis]
MGDVRSHQKTSGGDAVLEKELSGHSAYVQAKNCSVRSAPDVREVCLWVRSLLSWASPTRSYVEHFIDNPIRVDTASEIIGAGSIEWAAVAVPVGSTKRKCQGPTKLQGRSLRLSFSLKFFTDFPLFGPFCIESRIKKFTGRFALKHYRFTCPNNMDYDTLRTSTFSWLRFGRDVILIWLGNELTKTGYTDRMNWGNLHSRYPRALASLRSTPLGDLRVARCTHTTSTHAGHSSRTSWPAAELTRQFMRPNKGDMILTLRKYFRSDTKRIADVSRFTRKVSPNIMLIISGSRSTSTKDKHGSTKHNDDPPVSRSTGTKDQHDATKHNDDPPC